MAFKRNDSFCLGTTPVAYNHFRFLWPRCQLALDETRLSGCRFIFFFFKTDFSIFEDNAGLIWTGDNGLVEKSFGNSPY